MTKWISCQNKIKKTYKIHYYIINMNYEGLNIRKVDVHVINTNLEEGDKLKPRRSRPRQ